jgi:hypothetical protein
MHPFELWDAIGIEGNSMLPDDDLERLGEQLADEVVSTVFFVQGMLLNIGDGFDGHLNLPSALPSNPTSPPPPSE